MRPKIQECNSMCCTYLLGIIGAAVYYISKASTFSVGVIGFLKALVWPAYLVHGIMNHLAI